MRVIFSLLLDHESFLLKRSSSSLSYSSSWSPGGGIQELLLWLDPVCASGRIIGWILPPSLAHCSISAPSSIFSIVDVELSKSSLLTGLYSEREIFVGIPRLDELASGSSATVSTSGAFCCSRCSKAGCESSLFPWRVFCAIPAGSTTWYFCSLAASSSALSRVVKSGRSPVSSLASSSSVDALSSPFMTVSGKSSCNPKVWTSPSNFEPSSSSADGSSFIFCLANSSISSPLFRGSSTLPPS
mmetsp:Transcript_28035/g.78620  ORF Transcript_28035/g.78620 Transcript_28035/m.78620 type:complete len:243 (-) Transcript_28035:2638-3366(-)